MKVTATIGDLIDHHPQVARKYENGDLILAAARELGDSVSLEVIAANRRLAEVDRDLEHDFESAVFALNEAEARFLASHRDTRISL